MKLTIDKLNDEFTYEFKKNNKIYYLNKVIKDEIVDAEIIEKESKMKLLKIIQASPNRISPQCKYYNQCGGCSLQHINYQHQLLLKQQMVENLFKVVTKTKVMPIKATNQFLYRNKSQMVYGIDKNKKPMVGIYQEHSHNIIPVDKCLVEDELISKVQQIVMELINKFHYQYFNEKLNIGEIKHVLVKSTTTNEIMVVIVTKDQILKGSSNLVQALIARCDKIKTIIQNINPINSTHVLGKTNKILYGKGYITDKLLGFKFQIGPKSFYQINRFLTPLMYQEVVNNLKDKNFNTVLDAYSGTSTISIVVSPYVKKVLSVELEKDACDQALSNVVINNIKNVKVFNDDATRFINNLANKKEAIDCIIMDPPRSGSTKEFLNSVLKLNPKQIIYISCDPHTQVRDLTILNKQYEIKSIQPFDLFPNTIHVETICCLISKEK